MYIERVNDSGTDKLAAAPSISVTLVDSPLAASGALSDPIRPTPIDLIDDW